MPADNPKGSRRRPKHPHDACPRRTAAVYNSQPCAAFALEAGWEQHVRRIDYSERERGWKLEGSDAFASPAACPAALASFSEARHDAWHRQLVASAPLATAAATSPTAAAPLPPRVSASPTKCPVDAALPAGDPVSLPPIRPLGAKPATARTAALSWVTYHEPVSPGRRPGQLVPEFSSHFSTTGIFEEKRGYPASSKGSRTGAVLLHDMPRAKRPPLRPWQPRTHRSVHSGRAAQQAR